MAARLEFGAVLLCGNVHVVDLENAIGVELGAVVPARHRFIPARLLRSVEHPAEARKSRGRSRGSGHAVAGRQVLGRQVFQCSGAAARARGDGGVRAHLFMFANSITS